MSGMFFSFDGLDGTGKSTQLNCFAIGSASAVTQWSFVAIPAAPHWARRFAAFCWIGTNCKSTACRKCSCTWRPERSWSSKSSSRRWRPAKGLFRIGICWRTSSIRACGGLEVDRLWDIGRIDHARNRAGPDFLARHAAEAAAGRIQRELDRMEKVGDDFRQRCAGFLAEAAQRPEKMAVIDAGRSIDEVQAEIRKIAEQRLPR